MLTRPQRVTADTIVTAAQWDALLLYLCSCLRERPACRMLFFGQSSTSSSYSVSLTTAVGVYDDKYCTEAAPGLSVAVGSTVSTTGITGTGIAEAAAGDSYQVPYTYTTGVFPWPTGSRTVYTVPGYPVAICQYEGEW